MTKITPDHLARQAIVYIRQSTADQVANNLESKRRQYNLPERARQPGSRPDLPRHGPAQRAQLLLRPRHPKGRRDRLEQPGLAGSAVAVKQRYGSFQFLSITIRSTSSSNAAKAASVRSGVKSPASSATR